MNHLILGDPAHHLLDEARGFVGLSALTFTRIGKKHLLQPWLRCLTAAERIPNGKKGTLRGSGCPKVVGLSKEVGKQSSELRRTFIWVTLHHRNNTSHNNTSDEGLWSGDNISHNNTSHNNTSHINTSHNNTSHNNTSHNSTSDEGGEVVAIHHVTIHHITIHHITTIHHTTIHSSHEGWWWREVMSDGEGWWRREVVT